MNTNINNKDYLAEFKSILDIELKKVIDTPTRELKRIKKAKKEVDKFIRQEQR